MKNKTLILAAVWFFIVAAIPGVYAGEYRIGPGDVLEIGVWKNPDLQKQLAVLPDGTIQFPLVKEIRAAGLTVQELEARILQKLEKYIPEPDLFVSVVQVNSLMVYVIGKVNNPGRFPLNADIDVLQGLALAGGLNPFAKEKEIAVFRKNNKKTEIFTFNYEEVSEGEKLDQNITLRRGDVIVVR